MTRPLLAAVALLVAATLACATGPAEPPKIAPATAPAAGAASTPCDPCVLLMTQKFGDLRTGGWCEKCGECSEPFPRAEVTCKELDHLRNCIFARLGYGFEDAPEWRTVFDAEPWYVADPTFDWERVDEVQEYNARVLRDLVSGKRCER
jgi:hypothetical protein